jgi:methionyl-tRNA formyltransferase
MRVAFAGTPEFAARCLAAILRSHHIVCGVMTRPDRPSGRGLALAPSAVKKLAVERGLVIAQPATLRDERLAGELCRWEPEILVVAAYGLILPRTLLSLPRQGAINVHASLLPRWRGAAPIQRAILAGDRETGVSIMQMEEGLDTGPVLRRQAVSISEEDTAGTLHDRLADLGSKLIVDVLDDIGAGRNIASPQSDAGATYAEKLGKKELQINWTDSADGIRRLIRALDPLPGAKARIRGVEVKIWRCILASESGNAGEVLSAGPAGVLVACGERSLLLTQLQRPGGKRLAASDFLHGFPLAAGERFALEKD